MRTHILDLNDDCIACVLKYLPIENHMSFAGVCTRFRHVWLGYRNCLYKQLELGESSAKGLKQELLLLRQISRHVKRIVINFNRKFDWCGILFREIIGILKKLTALERAILWIKDDEPYETYEKILRAFEHLPNMQGIATYQDNCIVDSLYHFNECDELLAESRLSRNPLIEPIDRHTKIRLLIFNNASIRPTLEDLVRHSSLVQELSLCMIQKAAEYTALAELPNLCKLEIFGNRTIDYGSLMPLIAAVSSKLSQQLHTLTIHAPSLGYQETAKIAQIRTLRELDCDFTEPRCLELLIALDQLTHLSIKLPKSCPIDSLVLHILRECHSLNVIKIDSPDLGTDFLTEAYRVLQQVRNPNEKKPLVIILGDESQLIDIETNVYLRVVR
ncbi:uncharacterized protein LOC115766917 [Drosophila novamexicana]|uniref:uncharacterized protein LOC115766917 n=1 Tax=Drosophila novamexicana TaxID=47314 RepID=UPI0011E5A4F1|nr:uncharacterized protein LOC115766917 [Drosophila novamexicana]